MPLIIIKNSIYSHLDDAIDAEPAFYLVDGIIATEDIFDKSNEGENEIYFYEEDEKSNADVLVKAKGSNVNQTEFGIGKMIASTNFGPCHAIVAKLPGGNFAIYHSQDFLVSGDHTRIFLSKVMGSAEHFYIFARNKGVNDEQTLALKIRSTALHLDFAALVGDKVTCFEIDNYRAIVADGEKNRIYLSPLGIKTINNAEEVKLLDDEKAKYVAANKIVKTRTLSESISLMTEFLRREPHLTVGHNIHIAEIQTRLHSAEEKKAELPTPDNNFQKFVTDIISAEATLLSKKKMGMFHSITPVTKANEIIEALARANSHFKSLSPENIKDFLNYKEGENKSIIDALQLSRKKCTKSHMYTRIINKINSYPTKPQLTPDP